MRISQTRYLFVVVLLQFARAENGLLEIAHLADDISADHDPVDALAQLCKEIDSLFSGRE